MINVMVYRDFLGQIQEFKIQGHSGYAESGQDIVCAAVSAITQTAVMGLAEVAHISVNYHQRKGWSRCKLPAHLPAKKREAASMILDTMLIGLKSIEDQYGSFISIQEKEVE